MEQLVIAVRIHEKWKECRDKLKRFYLMDKEKGEVNYNRKMGMIQLIIKNHSKDNEDSQLKTIMEICDGLDGMMKVQVRAAGYELFEGNDLTSYYP
jgi:hypothetical protein